MTRYQMTSYLFLAVWVVQSSAEVSLVYHDYGVMPCNTSRVADGVDVGSIPIQILGPRVRQNLIGKPYFCQYEFVAPENHYVSAEIISVVTGRTSYNFTEETCGKRNFLRIWDGLRTSEWKPTEVCGRYQDGDISVKRIVSGREMKVEFRTQDFTEQTKYDVRITFHQTEISHARIETHYGAYGDVHGRISKTLCDWEIEVNKCIGHCQLTTPGYPGIYPPHTMCNYRLVNRDGERVELYLSGTSRDKGKFDLKRTEQCSEDKLVVYDGYNKNASIIGIFCGHQTVPEIISTGSALFLELHTLAGSPPWDYSGFDARVGHRFPSDFRTGQPMVGKPCSWEFNSTLERFGTIHSPDYKVLDKIECEYHFFGAADEYVEFEISITSLEPRREFIYIYGGSSTLPEKIWSDDLTPQRRQEKMINSSTHKPVIIYNLEGGQMSNAEPVFIYYTFMKRATVAPPVVVNDPKPSSKSGAQKQYPVLTVIVLTVLIVIIKLSEVA